MTFEKQILFLASITVGIFSIAAVPTQNIRPQKVALIQQAPKFKNQPPSVEEQQQGAIDAEIARQFRSQLLGDPAISPWGKNIDISVNEGQVVLKGFVRSDDERTRIERLAETLPGIEEISNNLSVNIQ